MYRNYYEGSEQYATRQVKDYLKKRGIFHWKVFQTLGCVKGVADIIGIYKGKFLAIEMKSATGRLTENQKIFLDRVTAEGGIAIMAKTLDDVIKGLDNVSD